ncbi:hypothetical protein [Lysinibacillus pakistanensis]|uniref:Uncharacterized protein n=1 Tax=Lysinibacillus pakistanensis TaxID=759811 RepID=A0AAX3WRF7_9BACI|nr:hypothetical protein [Lysinibacillus pakistanensis]MDM5229655.1 hypothetical protein [Lysinibacillus pakistanensis]WHY45272.1 hypothetical protein QNH22_18415 [Lysinibacillus pakistanensis]WHY50280.1 hypothetical protein QNH24_18380 [Lysinibacillus pakistanensis]
MVLYVLAQIWKFGGVIERDQSDGRLELKNHKNIPVEVLKAAEPIFNLIEEWFKSWEEANGIDKHMRMMIHQACGWQHNPKLNEWICADVDALMLFMEWQETLAKNGWNDIYTDYRQFENEESNIMKKKLYERAVLYANQNK